MKDLYKIDYSGKEITSQAKEIIEKYHYSQSFRSQMQVHVFNLTNKMTGFVEGVAIFGKPMGRNIDASDTLELRRFVLVDDAPRNSESWFLGGCLRWIGANDRNATRVLTFADPNKGHSGVIYKATNFEFDGMEKASNPRVAVIGDKEVHLRQYYQKRNGEYTNDALRYQQAVANGDGRIEKRENKLRYVYYLRG